MLITDLINYLEQIRKERGEINVWHHYLNHDITIALHMATICDSNGITEKQIYVTINEI